nr:DUF1566 domain-containing protein [Alteromonas facilis]
MRKLMLGMVMALGVLSTHVLAQECLPDSPQTTPSAEFLELTPEQIIHSRTGLVWMRCALGQTWDGNSCEGDASQLTWQEALQLAHGYQLGDSLGWRLPNLKELSTLVERRCVRPSINTQFFPNTPQDDFWTSTPSVRDPHRAWVVAFFNSSNSLKDKDRYVFVRLVRSALPSE